MAGVDVDGGIAIDLGGRGPTAERRRVRGDADRTVETAIPRRHGGRA
ncbi:hypothetical protein ACFQE8_01655 [Salinirubellus sp. GCM10025818]